ncbi:DNA repair protein RecO [Chitinispirillales bacterium ANBcel5]|uniref:DNA repair protein RecO n=1 Tax=Cellulosispirillum alkaliphilum TaxID=3039283 RepID=UPI002A594DC0|nr:DNA repair protein RecO [Chitinispirillales bacterium ANBcel5]
MSIEKSSAVVLSLTPYRETSCILRVLTPQHGSVNCIAKGVRRRDKNAIFLDRGFIIETLVYFKQNRDLHTLGSLSVAEFFPGIRADVVKSVIRDLALELVLKSSSQYGSNPVAYGLLSDFLNVLNTTDKKYVFPLLWHFFARFTEHLGFKIATEKCLYCLKPLKMNDAAVLNIARGSMVCTGCAGSLNGTTVFPGAVLVYFEQIDLSTEGFDSPVESLRITRALVDYCRYHLDVRTGFNSVEFLASII